MKAYISGALLLVLGLFPCVAAGQGSADSGPNRPDAARGLVRQGDVAVFAFGRGQPTLVCAEMRLCYIELQTGESLRGAPLLGDQETWSITIYTVGDSVDWRVEVGVTPLLCGVSTNMVVPTTRRRYELSLLSAPCRSVDDWDHNAVYTRRVRFSYPDDADWRAVQERAQEPSQAAQAPGAGGTAPVAPNACGAADGALAGVAVPLERLSFDYRWERKNGFPWEPVQVFDDGVHTYIRLPEHARQSAQPILYAVEASGARLVVNYAKPDPAAPCAAPFFVTDRIVAHLALVIGSAQRGGTPQVLHVYNRRLSGRR